MPRNAESIGIPQSDLWPQAPIDLYAALATIDRHIDDYANHGRLSPATRNLTHM